MFKGVQMWKKETLFKVESLLSVSVLDDSFVVWSLSDLQICEYGERRWRCGSKRRLNPIRKWVCIK